MSRVPYDHSEPVYRSVVEVQDGLICRLRPDMTLTMANEAFRRHFKQIGADLIGARFLSLLPAPERDAFQAHIQLLIESRAPMHYEREVVNTGGVRKWQEWKARPITNAAGEVVEIQLVGRDVTARKQLEQALESKDELLDVVAATTQTLLGECDLRKAAQRLLRMALRLTVSETAFVGVVGSDRVLRVVAFEGLNKDHLTDHPFYDHALREYDKRGYIEFAALGNLLGAAIESSEVLISNNPATDSRSSGLPDGHPPLKCFMGVPLRSADGVVGLLGVANREGGYSQDQYRALYTIIELAGALCADHRNSEHRERLEQACAEAAGSVQVSHERFEQLANTIEDAFWLYDWRTGAPIYVSPAYEQIWGRPVSGLFVDPEDWLRAVAPEDRRAVQRAWAAAGNGFDVKYRIVRPDGQHRWIHDRGFPVRAADGEVVRIAGIAKDITGQELAEQRLLDSERLLRAALDTLPAHIAILKTNGMIIAVNRAWREFADANGFAMPNYGIGANYVEICKAAEGDEAGVAGKVADGIVDVLEGRSSGFSIEYTCHAPSERRWFELRVARFAAPDIASAVTLHIDVTARRQAEEGARRQQAELAHMGRIAVMGELAAGIAHELNQPLASIANYTEGCLDRLREQRLSDEDFTYALERIRQLAHTSGEIIRRIRRITRKTEPRRSTVDLNELVRDVLDLLAHELQGHSVELELRLDEQLPRIQADSVQIQQVVMNLTLNAIMAMKAGDEERRRLTISTRTHDSLIEVAVIDTGPGFDGPMERLFEPFHSTRPGGLGLGLSISREIVEKHGGQMTAARADDRTFFRFTFPLPPANES